MFNARVVKSKALHVSLEHLCGHGQVSNIEKSVKVANERARHGDGQNMDAVNLNEAFVTDQRMEQQQIIRWACEFFFWSQIRPSIEKK